MAGFHDIEERFAHLYAEQKKKPSGLTHSEQLTMMLAYMGEVARRLLPKPINEVDLYNAIISLERSIKAWREDLEKANPELSGTGYNSHSNMPVINGVQE